jgi:hypothetical protein
VQRDQGVIDMKTKFLRCSQIVAVFATVVLGGNTARAVVGGPICNVPLDYPTIQLAVNDPGCATINVLSGLYSENVSINRALILNGAQAGNPAPGRVGAESTVIGMATIGAVPVFKIAASNVTIDGFSVTDPFVVSGAAVGIDVKNVVSGAVIKNNIVDTVMTPDLTGNGTAQAIYLEQVQKRGRTHQGSID